MQLLTTCRKAFEREDVKYYPEPIALVDLYFIDLPFYGIVLEGC